MEHLTRYQSPSILKPWSLTVKVPKRSRVPVVGTCTCTCTNHQPPCRAQKSLRLCVAATYSTSPLHYTFIAHTSRFCARTLTCNLQSWNNRKEKRNAARSRSIRVQVSSSEVVHGTSFLAVLQQGAALRPPCWNEARKLSVRIRLRPSREISVSGCGERQAGILG